MSVLPPKADTLTGGIDVRFVPETVIRPHERRSCSPRNARRDIVDIERDAAVNGSLNYLPATFSAFSFCPFN